MCVRRPPEASRQSGPENKYPMNIRKLSVPTLLLCTIEVFLLLYFPPSLILDPSVTTGGDTHPHFISAVVMRAAASFFSPVTWFHGNFGGFPLFLHYFPFPFMLMSILSLLTSLEVAFKLVTLLAIIPLPAAVFYCLRRLGYPGQVCAAGAALTLPFLMMTENHMWGGNIASTLAGEFSFGISFILAIILAGRLFADVPRGRSLIPNSIIESLIALCNGYPVLHCGMATSYFLIRGRSTRYIACLHALALGWAAFWILPLMRDAAWNTPFAHWWSFQSVPEIFPPVLWPSFAGTSITLGFHIGKLFQQTRTVVESPPSPVHPGVSNGTIDPMNAAEGGLGAIRPPGEQESGPSPETYLWWHFGIALLGFGIAPYFGLVDIRFLPFAQIAAVMLGAIGWSRLILWLPRPNLWLTVFTLVMIVFSFTRSGTAESWIRWNYSGTESKPLMEPFRQTNRFLAGTENDPRVVYEHSNATNGAGTVRAFEMLPFHSGRSTLEGLYMQSALSAPFVYYIQSEISQTPTMILTNFYYSRFNPHRAAEHLRLFNVNQIIALSDSTCNAFDASPDFEPQVEFPPFRIYLLKDAEYSYVTPLRFQPFRIPKRGWKAVQYEWFRKSSLKTPLIVADDGTPGDYWKRVPVYEGTYENLPENPITAASEEIKADAHLSGNRVSISTSKPGHPLWLKISYHPRWRVSEGDGELYPASPSFMLLVPKTAKMVLEFDTRSGVFLLGKALTVLTACLCAGILSAVFWRKKRSCRSQASEPPSPARDETTQAHSRRWPQLPSQIRLPAASIVMVAVVLGTVFSRSETNPQLLFDKAMEMFDRTEQFPGSSDQTLSPAKTAEKERMLTEALTLFDKNISRFPESAVFDFAVYYKAILLAGKDPVGVRQMLEAHLATHPDSRILAESLLIIGEIHMQEGETEEAEEYFRQAVLTWPEVSGGRRAGEHLAEIIGADTLFDEARYQFESGNYLHAYSLLRSLIFLPDDEIRDKSVLWLGYCCFHLNRWEEASNLFMQWINNHFDDPRSPDVEATLHHCNIMISTIREWRAPEPGITTPMGKALRLFGLVQ